MVRAVHEQDAHAGHRRARKLAARHGLLDPFVDRRPEALRNDAADDLVHELVALVARERLQHDLAVAELAPAAGLLLVAPLGARFLADRLQVRDPWLCSSTSTPKRRLSRSTAASTHLREAAEELLAGLVVAAERQRRVLLGQAPKGGAHLLLVALGLRLDREAHHRLGEVERRDVHRCVGAEQHVAGGRLLQLGHGADVALTELVRLLVILPLEDEQLADALLVPCAS